MSLNWKEINCILEELDLSGSQIQGVLQSSFDLLSMNLYKGGKARTILIALTPGACRLHETQKSIPKPERPLRFTEFLRSRILNGWIQEACQLGSDRIVRFSIQRGEHRYYLYCRLWSNAANVILTDESGTILDAMRRLPKRGEITGGIYRPEEHNDHIHERDLPARSEEKELPGQDSPTLLGKGMARIYEIRDLPGTGSFNQKIDEYYATTAGALSLERLKEEIRRIYEARQTRLAATIENLEQKRASYGNAEQWKQYGDLIMAHIGSIQKGQEWLETSNFYTGETVRIRLDPYKTAVANAESWYEQYRKAKQGYHEVEEELKRAREREIALREEQERLLSETNPFRLYHTIRKLRGNYGGNEKKRPGLTFIKQGWTIIVGRDARENDELLRHHVKGSDLWLHTRDVPGGYVFIKARKNKTVPLEILLDAGNLAVFYSKARNAGSADLYYTAVKYLRRVKEGKPGLVIPTQEKNLHIKLEESRLRELENCRSDVV
ncbi:MAG: NFACT family protein [Treponemataceae bacterium]|nr:NFACT family protein [Treponemataceae bacterium]